MEGHDESKAEMAAVKPVKADPELADETSSVPTVEEEKMERNLIWKIDLYILPFVVLLYLFSFLDRGMLAHFFILTHGGIMIPCKDRILNSGSKHWKCTAIRSGRRLGSSRGPIPNRSVDFIRHLLCTFMSNPS